jgi:hypothetical protein
MSPPSRFLLFGPDHLAVLFLTLALPALLVLLVRSRGGERRIRPICRGLAATLILSQVILLIYVVRPWYIASLEVVGLVLFFLFYTPFALGDAMIRSHAD